MLIISFLHDFLTLLLAPSPSKLLILKCFFILMVISASVALVATIFTKKHLDNSKLSFFFFLLVTQCFTPIIGTFLVILSIFVLKYYHKKIYPLEMTTFKKPVYYRREPIKILPYAEGWAAVRLELTHFSQEERKQALVSLSRGSKRHVNHIYNQLVSDNMEEIRICAFSLLEIQQNHLHEKINELLKLYQSSTVDYSQAFYAKQLALLYWELIYLNLGEKEFRKISLEKSKWYADMALKFFKNDPFLLILLARIAIENQDYEKGIKLLLSAEKYKAPLSKIYPYLAEYSYHHQDYQSVKKYLSRDDTFKDIIRIGNVVNFWCDDDRISLQS